MARISIEDAGSRSPREAREGAREAKVGSGKSPKQAIMIGVALVAFAVAGVLIYTNMADSPKPGDQLAAQELTADPATPVAHSGPAPAAVTNASSAPTQPKKLAVDTPPVPGTQTTAGPTSRSAGAPR